MRPGATGNQPVFRDTSGTWRGLILVRAREAMVHDPAAPADPDRQSLPGQRTRLSGRRDPSIAKPNAHCQTRRRSPNPVPID